ncbi:MAG: phosphatase PAP2 family protein [Bacillota bacterium]
MIISWAVFLQRFRTPWLDKLAYLITCLGSAWFFIAALPVLYWTWNKRAGYRIAVFYLLGAYVNSALKVAFHTPRPGPVPGAVVMHPETGPGYSFPSGHAQGSTVFWGQFALEVRTVFTWALAIILTLLVSLSRLYLNVHWPVDVLGGILVGMVLLLLFNAASALWERLYLPFWFRLLCTLALPAAMYLVYRGDDAHLLIGFLLGFPLGHLMEERYVGWSERASPIANVLKVLVGLGGLLAIRYGLKLVLPINAAADIARYALAGLWAGFGAPLLFVAMGWHD